MARNSFSSLLRASMKAFANAERWASEMDRTTEVREVPMNVRLSFENMDGEAKSRLFADRAELMGWIKENRREISRFEIIDLDQPIMESRRVPKAQG